MSIGTAVVAGRVDTTKYTMSLSQLENCAANGVEILSHTNQHLTLAKVTNMEIEEIYEDYKAAQDFLAVNGFKSDALVFPGASAGVQKCVNVASELYSYAFRAGSNKTNYKYSTQRYGIDRWDISPDETLTMENLQAMIDSLVDAKTGWMIWMIHTSDENFQQEEADIISEMIDYACQNGVEIVTTQRGVEEYVVD